MRIVCGVWVGQDHQLYETTGFTSKTVRLYVAVVPSIKQPVYCAWRFGSGFHWEMSVKRHQAAVDREKSAFVHVQFMIQYMF